MHGVIAEKKNKGMRTWCDPQHEDDCCSKKPIVENSLFGLLINHKFQLYDYIYQEISLLIN